MVLNEQEKHGEIVVWYMQAMFKYLMCQFIYKTTPGF